MYKLQANFHSIRKYHLTIEIVIFLLKVSDTNVWTANFSGSTS